MKMNEKTRNFEYKNSVKKQFFTQRHIKILLFIIYLFIYNINEKTLSIH